MELKGPDTDYQCPGGIIGFDNCSNAGYGSAEIIRPADVRRTGVEVTGLSKLCHTRAISAVLSVVWPRPYVGMFTRGEQTVGKWRFVVSVVYPHCTIPENDKVNIAL